MAKKVERYQLKDQETTFFDPETRLKVVREGVVELDPSKRKGKLTLAAIKAGGLIEVNTEPKASAGKGKDKDNDTASKEAKDTGKSKEK